MQGNIAAGIVLFNPESDDRVQKSIQSILEQVNKVYIFDNSTKKINLTFPDSVTYLTEHDNKGIAYALNRIMEKAGRDGYEWLVTMDQDSVIPNGLIASYEKHISEPSMGIICPQVIDSRRSYMEAKKEPKEELVEYCITSASCTRISAWERIGKFDEWMFIDLVDNDFCKRLTLSGYKILRINTLILNQQFGNIIPKSKKTQMFWNKIANIVHNDNFGKLGYKKIVSPIRVYYTNRNIIYLNKKLKGYKKSWYRDNYNCKNYVGFLISFVLPSVLRANTKREVIKATIKGIQDGQSSNPRRWKKHI